MPLIKTANATPRGWVLGVFSALVLMSCRAPATEVSTASGSSSVERPIDAGIRDADAIVLPEVAQGQRAIDLLGDRLAEVASRYGMSAAELRSLLLRDRSLWVDRSGGLFYSESPPSSREPSK